MDPHELLACPLPTCQAAKQSNHTVDGLLVPSALRFQSSDFTCSERTLCTSNETFCTVVSSEPHSEVLYLGFGLLIGAVEICLANTLSPNGTNSCDRFLPCSLFQMVLSHRHLSDTWIGYSLRVPPQVRSGGHKTVRDPDVGSSRKSLIRKRKKWPKGAGHERHRPPKEQNTTTASLPNTLRQAANADFLCDGGDSPQQQAPARLASINFCNRKHLHLQKNHQNGGVTEKLRSQRYGDRRDDENQ